MQEQDIHLYDQEQKVTMNLFMAELKSGLSYPQVQERDQQYGR
jgi:hypothetical protein